MKFPLKTISRLTFCLTLAMGQAPSLYAESVQELSSPDYGPSISLSSGIELENMEKKFRPQDDFYRFVNGKWLENTEIPADKTNFGSFSQLAEDAEKNIKAIIEDAAQSKTPAKLDENQQRIRALYLSFMDEKAIEKLGLKPLTDDFAQIDKMNSIKDLPAYFAKAAVYGGGQPFGFYVYQDAKNSTEYTVYFGQSGLGLPDRDFYTKEDERSKNLQSAYQVHISKMLSLAGFKDTEKLAKNIYALEKRLAEVQWTRVQSRDASKRYNRYEKAELNKLMPSFNWDVYLQNAQLDKQGYFIVSQPSYFKALDKIITSTDISIWKSYAKWHLLQNYAPYLNQSIVNENFEFQGKTLSGAEEIRPRWKRGVAVVNQVLGESVGQVYVKRHFNPQAKAKMEVLVENLIKASEQSIKELDWMTEETKVKALEKLNKFTPKIGYPNRWKDYSALSLKQKDLIGNIKQSYQYESQRAISKLGKPIDREEWFMTPQTVNAYYNPVMNEIVFPAAILQPPFFDLNADDAVNYGAIGAVIGHEIGHGFDDQGSKYDGDGNLNNWWTEKDLKEFKSRTGQLVAQYNQYQVLDGQSINGEFTLGENIGDLGGLSIAYKAYLLSLEGKKPKVIDNFTGKQ
ncbi:MAG: M13-type metalloendopeptidase, partial [Pseudomonadota bacterium]